MFAQRLREIPIKDPKMVIGLLLVAGGGALGGLVLSDGDMVAIAQVAEEIPAGDTLDGRVTFVDVPIDSAGPHVRASDRHQTMRTRRSLSAGEFVNKSDLIDDTEPNSVDVRLPLAEAPSSSVMVGDRIEIWRVNNQTAPGTGPGAERLAIGTLLAVSNSDGFAARPTAELRVDPTALSSVLAALGGGDSFVVIGYSYGGEST